MNFSKDNQSSSEIIPTFELQNKKMKVNTYIQTTNQKVTSTDFRRCMH